MATHVIEIVGGIGEPAFVPLTMGKESPTLSIGRRGQWKVEGAGILDVHAYAYFDGQALFLQSTDPNNAACVDGFPVGTAWTEVRPPCSIELGGARLEYREEDSGDDATQAIATPMAAPPRPPTPAPAAGRPPEQGRTNPPPPGPVPVPAASVSGARPFQPGAFSNRQEDEGESTRVAPLDVSASRAGPRPAGGFAGVQQPAMLSGAFPNPMLQQPPPPPMGQMGQMGQMAPPMQPPMQAPMMDPNGYGMQPQPPMMDPNGYGMQPPQAPMMGAAGSGGYPQQPPGFAPFPGQGSMPGGPGFDAYGQPLAAQPPQEEDALKKAIADFKTASPVRKMVLILLPVAMLAAAVMLLSDDPPPPTALKPDAGVGDAGLAVVPEASTAPTETVVQTAPVPTPPVPPPPPTGGTTTEPTVAPPPSGKPPPQPSPVTSTDGGTLERKALDELYRGDLAKSAEAYEKLAREQPQNPSYAYAAKILRERLAAGQGVAPPTGAPK